MRKRVDLRQPPFCPLAQRPRSDFRRTKKLLCLTGMPPIIHIPDYKGQRPPGQTHINPHSRVPAARVPAASSIQRFSSIKVYSRSLGSASRGADAELATSNKPLDSNDSSIHRIGALIEPRCTVTLGFEVKKSTESDCRRTDGAGSRGAALTRVMEK
jgi:hypothetical protein